VITLMGNNKMAETGQPRLVKASYNFKATNNDEVGIRKLFCTVNPQIFMSNFNFSVHLQ
jgi:hypothetical protein